MSAGSRFDRTAERYADHARHRDWGDFVAWCRPQPGDRALDVAGGPGLLSAALRPAVAAATVVDASQRLLDLVPDGVERVHAQAERLPFADGAFDLVTCVMALHHVASPPRALDEMARVLAAGGRIVLEDMIADADPEIARRWQQLERLRDPEHGKLLELGEARRLLLAAGLTVDAEETWLRTVDTDHWIAAAGCSPRTAARLREAVGAPRFEQRMWRARFHWRQPAAD